VNRTTPLTGVSGTIHDEMRTVRTPSGDEWKVGRRWLGRRTRLPRWRRATDLGIDGFDAASLLDFDSGIAVGIALLVIGVLALFVLIPLLLFGIELIAVGAVLAAGILGRVLLGRPWTIEARNLQSNVTRTWEVSGWQQSATTIGEISATLAAGGQLPHPRESEMLSAHLTGRED
jgi:hypothetical protein